MQFLRLRRFTLETLPTRMAKAYASLYLCARSCKEMYEKERRFGTIWQHLRFRSRDVRLAGAGERLDVLAPCSSLAAFMSLSRRGWRIRCAQNSLMRHTTGWRLGFWRWSMVLSIFSLQCNWGPTLVRRRHNSGLWL